MKFRTLRRINYLFKAGHRGGHGIHSPFLFHLITTVIEDKIQYPEYGIFEKLRIRAIKLLNSHPEGIFPYTNNQTNLQPIKTRKLFDRIELPLKYGKLLFRLIREFKPSSVVYYGPSQGVNLATMAMADNLVPTYQVWLNPEQNLLPSRLLNDYAISNIIFPDQKSELKIHADFSVINFADNPEMSRKIVQKCLDTHADNGLLILRGIHQSIEMEELWNELISDSRVRVTLDLFEIGLVMFRKGLQKENFILRF